MSGQFIEELTVQNKALQKEEERKNKQLRKLNLEINKLQMKKKKIDLKFTNKIDVDSLTDQISQYYIIFVDVIWRKKNKYLHTFLYYFKFSKINYLFFYSSFAIFLISEEYSFLNTHLDALNQVNYVLNILYIFSIFILSLFSSTSVNTI